MKSTWKGIQGTALVENWTLTSSLFEMIRCKTAVSLPYTSLNCLNRQHWLVLTRFALVVMIVGSKREREREREWEHLILLWIIKKQASERQNFMEINLSSFDYDFCLTRCRSLLFYVLLKTSYVFMGYRKGTSEWNGLIFQLTKVLSTNKIWAQVNNGVWGQGQLFLKK